MKRRLTGNQYVVPTVLPDWDDIPNHQPITAESLDYLYGDERYNEERHLLTL